MSTHLYAFGSICRGEIDASSDIDLLACLSAPKAGINPDRFSIYTHTRLRELWQQGNPFAWHLHLESRILFSSDGEDFVGELGRPNNYTHTASDCEKFRLLFSDSLTALRESSNSRTFNLSCMFLATRNFATCFALGEGKPTFSRYSPFELDSKFPISREDFEIFARARILSTRGYGPNLTDQDIERAMSSSPSIVLWMKRLALEYLSMGYCSD